jgi:pimeloyl-ACP methyl ester carboxylesterase
VCDVAGDALDTGLAALRAAGAAGEALARRLARPMHDLLDTLRPLTDIARRVLLTTTPGGQVLSDLLDIGGRLLDQLARECDATAAPADGSGGSGNAVLAVGGIDSHRDQAIDAYGRAATSFDFQAAKLGYRPDDVHYFSYLGHSTTYGSPDTHRPILDSARMLADQLRAWARQHPGRKFDLVGHSQGGVVILAFLAFYYQGHEAQYPPIDNVVTFASPLAGAPLATAVAEIRQALLGRALLDAVGAFNPYAPPQPSSPSVLDLAESSRLMRKLADYSVPSTIHWTSITGSMDFVVPAQQGHLPGATEVTVTVGNWWSPVDDHSGILRDDEALVAARAGLEHRSPPCSSIGTALVGAVAPVAFARVTHTAGDLGWLATSAVP